MTDPRPAIWISVVVAILVAVPVAWLVADVTGNAPSKSGNDSPGPSGVQPARLCAGCLTTHPSGNFSIPLPGPSDLGKNLFVVDGTGLAIEARIEVANFSALGVPTVNVHFPTTEAMFDLKGGQLDFNLSNREVNVTAPGWNGTSILQTSIVLPNTTFNGSGAALLTSSMVAVMTQLSWGTLSLNISWRWEISPPGMAADWSNWSGDQSVVPDQFLSVSSTGPLTMLAGAPFSVCVTGGIGGRTLSLHAETPNPYYDFAQVNATIPQNTSGPYCWSVPIPANDPNNDLPWVTPALLVVHIWDYQDFRGPHFTTLLLYVIQVTLVHAYAITIHEKGLPAGTPWNATIGGVTILSDTATARFEEPNGSYSFRIGAVPGWTTKFTGTVRVNGSNVGAYRTFTQKVYAVTFRETGLPEGTNWSVTINALASSSTLNHIKFHVPNGSYSYFVANVTNYTWAGSGSFTINDNGTSIWVHFSHVKHSGPIVVFGLPDPTRSNNSFDAVTAALGSNLLPKRAPQGTACAALR